MAEDHPELQAALRQLEQELAVRAEGDSLSSPLTPSVSDCGVADIDSYTGGGYH